MFFEFLNKCFELNRSNWPMISVSSESFRPDRVHETLVQTLVIKESNIDFEKNLRPSKHLRAKKTSLAVSMLTIPYVQWWGRVEWLVGYWQVKLYQSQVNLWKKFCFDSEPNPLRVDKSGLHRKKSNFRLFLTAASYSPLQKTPKKPKNVGGTCQKKRTRMSPFRI